LDHPRGAKEIGLEHPTHLVERNLLDRAIHTPTRVVHQGVHFPRLRNSRAHGIVAVDVEGELQSDVEVPQGLRAAGGRHHLVTSPSQLDRSLATESRRTAGDQDPHATSNRS
jgi:hypothetical protein